MPFDQPIPRQFTSSAVLMYAPAASGVYGISNAREWIFIGEGANIQQALLAHLEIGGASAMTRGPAGFVFEVCDPARRSSRQERLVLEYRPTSNRRAPRL